MRKLSAYMARYRFKGELPCAVRFANGAAMLFEYMGDDGQYYVTARKPDERGSEITLLRAETLWNFYRLKCEGFSLEAGSPADTIMRRLLRTGAVEIVSDEGLPPAES